MNLNLQALHEKLHNTDNCFLMLSSSFILEVVLDQDLKLRNKR